VIAFPALADKESIMKLLLAMALMLSRGR